MPRRTCGHLADRTHRLLPGLGLLERQLSGWLRYSLLPCGTGLRPAQLAVLDFAPAFDGQLGPALSRGGRVLPRAAFLLLTPAALFLSAVPVLAA